MNTSSEIQSRAPKPSARNRTMLLAIAVVLGLLSAFVPVFGSSAEAQSLPIECEDLHAGSGATAPSQDLVTYMAQWSTQGSRDFDTAGNDRLFGHSFDLDVTAGRYVVSGTVQIAATLGGSNDTFQVGDFPNQPMGGAFLSPSGYPMNTPGVRTFDLAALPRLGSTVNVLNNMTTSANLDVLVQDDTLVDYINVHYCTAPILWCQAMTVQTGPSAPGPNLAAYMAQFTNQGSLPFDVLGVNQLFGHTFNINVPAGRNVVSGILTMGATVSGQNDTFQIGDFPNQPMGGALMTAAGFQINTPGVQTFNLAALPRGGATVSVLNNMTTSSNLDVLVQDDTLVNFLTLNYCTAPVGWNGPIISSVVAPDGDVTRVPGRIGRGR